MSTDGKRIGKLESLAESLRGQLDLLKRALGPVAVSSSSSSTAAPVSKSQAPPGAYVVFLSTSAEEIPYDVIGAYLMASRALKGSPIKVTLVNKQMNKVPSLLTPSKQSISGRYNITRLLYRLAGKEPKSLVDSTLMDELTQRCVSPSNYLKKEGLKDFTESLNAHLQSRSYLVGYFPSSLDYSLFQSLFLSPDWQKMKESIAVNHGPFHLLRYYNTLLGSSLIKESFEYVNKQQTCKKDVAVTTNSNKGNNNKQNKGGKGNNSNNSSNKPNNNKKKNNNETASWDIGIGPEWNGKIVTRFPPEPSGYLHIGHAKAAVMNREIANRYNGTMLVRFDDTNPSKEKAEFVENISRDLKSLDVIPDKKITHTSDYFELYLKYCEDAIKKNIAYADDTPAEEMKQERQEKRASKCRDKSVKESLEAWEEMKKGTDKGLKTCIRIKIDPSSDNGTLRDPVIYRCNINDPHPMTGTTYKVYPTYDFACPIADSVEGVTHALRSKEYNERDIQYSIIWDLVCAGKTFQNRPLVKPNMYQFARMEFVRTQLSKRKLQAMIDSGKANGWDDPRLPTIQGIFRRGLQVEALKQFVFESATSTRNNLQEWDKLWTFNKKILDPIVSRYFAIEISSNEVNNYMKLRLENVENNTCISAPLLPKFPDGKKKPLHVSKEILLEKFDIDQILSQQPKKIGLMNLGIIDIIEINKNKNEIIAKLNTEDKNYKKKQICTWITSNVKDCVPMTLVELDYLFTSDGETNEENTWFETFAYGEPALRMVKKGEVIQLIKRGFFICDKPYLGRSDEPAVFIFVPDGKSSAMSKLASATNKVKSATR